MLLDVTAPVTALTVESSSSGVPPPAPGPAPLAPESLLDPLLTELELDSLPLPAAAAVRRVAPPARLWPVSYTVWVRLLPALEDAAACLAILPLSGCSRALPREVWISRSIAWVTSGATARGPEARVARGVRPAVGDAVDRGVVVPPRLVRRLRLDRLRDTMAAAAKLQRCCAREAPLGDSGDVAFGDRGDCGISMLGPGLDGPSLALSFAPPVARPPPSPVFLRRNGLARPPRGEGEATVGDPRLVRARRPGESTRLPGRAPIALPPPRPRVSVPLAPALALLAAKAAPKEDVGG